MTQKKKATMCDKMTMKDAKKEIPEAMKKHKEKKEKKEKKK